MKRADMQKELAAFRQDIEDRIARERMHINDVRASLEARAKEIDARQARMEAAMVRAAGQTTEAIYSAIEQIQSFVAYLREVRDEDQRERSNAE